MAFNPLTNDSKPVKETVRIDTSSMKVYSCKEFTGELSSVTGIYSKFLYIGKISELTGEPSTPTVRIICEPECVESCQHLYRRLSKGGKVEAH